VSTPTLPSAPRPEPGQAPGSLHERPQEKPQERPQERPPERSPGRKALTIGAVCKLLAREFPDISISKIRYLEDQKLVSPRRTQGGYRLYSQTDVTRLRTILRLQRDEFLPLRVIRQELASGRADEEDGPPAEAEQRRRRISLDRSAEDVHTLDEIVDATGTDERLVRELEEHGLVRGDGRAGERKYDSIEREIVQAVVELTRYGVAPRNLRLFRTSAEREATLLEQLLGPALRSRNPERRKEAVESLESLAALVSHLQNLLLVRDLRRLAR
jgi:DNA-binding transcriptional MerR regulator